MKKTIIGVWGTANVGKSMTLSNLGSIIQENGGVTNNDVSRHEYRAIFEYRSITIGVQTYGDLEQLILEGVAIFQEHNCDIIAIATKSYGDTVDALVNFAREQGYRIIWTTPYDSRDGGVDIEFLKNYKARNLHLMIDDIISGVI